MTNYQVRFFNQLLSADGHQFKVLQRVIRVRGANSSEDAACCAQRRFAEMEHVPDWKLRATMVEIAADPPKRTDLEHRGNEADARMRRPSSAARSGGWKKEDLRCAT